MIIPVVMHTDSSLSIVVVADYACKLCGYVYMKQEIGTFLGTK